MTISLVTLGRIRCLLGAEELSELPHQRKRCALLVYLAIEREVTRESLYNLFWSDRDEEKARGALKQTMYELRRQLGADWVDPRPDPLTISETVHTDAADFENAALSGDVTAALALYRGDFLREFSLGGSKEFEFWLDRKRAYYSRLHRTARRKRIAELMEAGASSEALLVARQWVELEPRDDEAQHNLIELLAGTGQRTEALRQYESYERMLAGDQLQPLEETAALIATLRVVNTDQALLRRPVSAATKAEQQRYALHRSVRQPRRWPARAIGIAAVSSVAIMAFLALVLNGARASLMRSVAQAVASESKLQDPNAAASIHELRPEIKPTTVPVSIDELIATGTARGAQMYREEIHGLKVAPRASAFAPREKDIIVDGRYRREGNTSRVTVSLIDSRTGDRLWRRTFRGEFDAAGPVRELIARTIRDAVQKVTATQMPSLAPATDAQRPIDIPCCGRRFGVVFGDVRGVFLKTQVRDSSRLNLKNEPVIYVDGVRVDRVGRVGPSIRNGRQVSRINDLNPEDIESIEVIKGPAAATLYGTEASRGVLWIITRSGSARVPRLETSIKYSATRSVNPKDRLPTMVVNGASTLVLESNDLYGQGAEAVRPIFQNGSSAGLHTQGGQAQTVGATPERENAADQDFLDPRSAIPDPRTDPPAFPAELATH